MMLCSEAGQDASGIKPSYPVHKTRETEVIVVMFIRQGRRSQYRDESEARASIYGLGGGN